MRKTRSYPPDRWWLNKTISAARSAWYATERLNLAFVRPAHDWNYSLLGPLMPEPAVSVYIPTHNRRKLLMERALKSVLAQTYRNIEAIVVADNCSDDTLEAVRLCGDARVRGIDHRGEKSFPHKAEYYWFAGRASPANAGLSECQGDWIATIDDDDEWTPDHLETLLAHARAHDLEFVSSAYERVRNGKREIVWNDGETPPAGGINTWVYRRYLSFMKFNPDCWRKSRNRVCDTDLIDRFRKAGVRMGIVRKITARVLPRPGDNTVGLAAYLADRNKTEKHFSFG